MTEMNKQLFLKLFLLLQLGAFAQNAPYFDTVFTDYFRRTSSGWKAGDGTISVPLPDGRVLWLFGDSHIAAVDTNNNTLPCLFQIRNCMMVQDSLNRNYFKTIIDSIHTGVNQTPFKLVLSDTTLFWPDHGYVWNDTVYLFMGRFNNSDMGKFYGEYLVKLDYPGLHLIGMYPLHPTNGIIYGRSVLIDTAADYLYMYGNKLNWIVWEPYLARCNVNNIYLPWEYYTGSGWSTLPSQAHKISSEVVSPGYSVVKRNGKYYLISQQNGYLLCGQGREIYSCESPTPYGPFTNKQVVYTEESKLNGKYLVSYNAQAHPFFTQNNELLISYNVNNGNDTATCYVQCTNVWTDRMDADSYRPKFIRVPFEKITGTQLHNFIKTEARILPNPVIAESLFSCELNLAGTGELTIALYDNLGRMVSQSKSLFNKGLNTLSIQAPATKGIYFLSIRNNMNENKVLKLIVY